MNKYTMTDYKNKETVIEGEYYDVGRDKGEIGRTYEFYVTRTAWYSKPKDHSKSEKSSISTKHKRAYDMIRSSDYEELSDKDKRQYSPITSFDMVSKVLVLTAHHIIMIATEKIEE